MTKTEERKSIARESLPVELRESFDALYDDYRFFAQKNTRALWVHPQVIADLVLQGWRLSGEPLPIAGVTNP